ncbi:uncharacterized protein LOC127253320 [Andrographis paniculata]|uniref:uncharacterized protein LOC127253320 n=1 Tax=Andrographis paniculata TaxID=175694 RepID=UPI0021E8C470|nr:uncharacterized protein LOC127253320 [Andrographis paniculata]
MDFRHSNPLVLAALVILSAAIDGAQGAAMVTGTVFCDQCRDGQVSLFDYPLYGIKVAMACPGSDGQYTLWGEETTNWLGNYVLRFDGSPDLSRCYAQVAGNRRGTNRCGAVAGPPKHLRIILKLFDMEMYAVDPLVAQPAAPMPFCPRTARPGHFLPARPAPPVRIPNLPPRVPARPPPVRLPALPPRPPQLPPLPPSPPVLEVSACSYRQWMAPEHRCHWRVVAPGTKVAAAFGLIAARRYGTEISLEEALTGRGEPYNTLLREGTTALLNSYNSIGFSYHPVAVIQHMNLALMGSKRQVLRTAMNFMKANSGAGGTCRLTKCK